MRDLDVLVDVVPAPRTPGDDSIRQMPDEEVLAIGDQILDEFLMVMHQWGARPFVHPGATYVYEGVTRACSGVVLPGPDDLRPPAERRRLPAV